MRRQLRLVLTVFLASLGLSLAVRAAAPPPDAPEYGPAKGSLIIIGGNMQDGSGLAQKLDPKTPLPEFRDCRGRKWPIHRRWDDAHRYGNRRTSQPPAS